MGGELEYRFFELIWLYSFVRNEPVFGDYD